MSEQSRSVTHGDPQGCPLPLSVVPMLVVVCVGLAGCGSTARKTDQGGGGSPEEIQGLIQKLAISQAVATHVPVPTPAKSDTKPDRVVAAHQAAEALRGLGKRALPLLVDHLGDNRQSISLSRRVPSSVGSTCYDIIEHIIVPLPADYPKYMHRVGADGKTRERPLLGAAGPFDASTVRAWLKARGHMSLSQLRADALRWIVAEETSIGFASDSERERILGPLLEAIEALDAE